MAKHNGNQNRVRQYLPKHRIQKKKREENTNQTCYRFGIGLCVKEVSLLQHRIATPLILFLNGVGVGAFWQADCNSYSGWTSKTAPNDDDWLLILKLNLKSVRTWTVMNSLMSYFWLNLNTIHTWAGMKSFMSYFWFNLNTIHTWTDMDSLMSFDSIWIRSIREQVWTAWYLTFDWKWIQTISEQAYLDSLI